MSLALQLVAFGSFGLTIGLVLSRPQLTQHVRVGPGLAAAAGVSLMLAAGVIDLADVGRSVEELWQPFVTIASIMVMAAVALRIGLLHRLAANVFPLARGSVRRLFALVFLMSAITAAVLNNDSAVLLLTPLVVLLVRAAYPEREALVAPFAFAVFMAAGVAPLVVSNPMNMIVADFAGIGFNEYAARMLPIAVVGWAVSYLVLRVIFRRHLNEDPVQRSSEEIEPWTPGQRRILLLLVLVLVSYPVVSLLGGHIWIVAAVGAGVASWLCHKHSQTKVPDLLRNGISWQTLAFLLGVFMLALGLRNAGLVGWLSSLYETTPEFVTGGVSALGSALINNHPMALVNLLAIRAEGSVPLQEILAALIGGDLGPRLLPIGSLAGLLWFEALRRLDVEIPVRQFVTVGVLVTVPSLAVSLGLLAWVS